MSVAADPGELAGWVGRTESAEERVGAAPLAMLAALLHRDDPPPAEGDTLFDLVNDPQELHNLYGEPGHEAITAELKCEPARLQQSRGATDQFSAQQLPNGVDGPVAKLRGK